MDMLEPRKVRAVTLVNIRVAHNVQRGQLRQTLQAIGRDFPSLLQFQFRQPSKRHERLVGNICVAREIENPQLGQPRETSVSDLKVVTQGQVCQLRQEFTAQCSQSD